MKKKTEFHSVAFFRRIRDQQAAALVNKSPEEIIAFFRQDRSRPTRRLGSRAKSSARRST
jgi:hypothetical protein